MLINDNSSALGIQNASRLNQQRIRSSLFKLATGLRINSASDDAAGLASSETLRAQIRGSQMAQTNSNDALAMLQIADSGGQQISDVLQRMRELAIQSSNSTYSAADRSAMQSEYASLASEVSAISQGTTYNGQNLLSGQQKFSFQVGDSAQGTSVLNVSTNALSSAPSFGDVSNPSSAQGAIGSIDSLMRSVMAMRSGLGASMNRLSAASTNLGNDIAATTDAESRIRDTDFAQETTQLALAQILNKSSSSMLAQANLLPSGVMGLL